MYLQYKNVLMIYFADLKVTDVLFCSQPQPQFSLTTTIDEMGLLNSKKS